eukprot:gnl/TRDRNA2_/TRDRNA2_176959_c1_seq5.p2 gnl/TRDRNA2_/TRDRNA2_176959_c1~~gnl/TRDRNA2_/TRDRNA2_176959_c1_seq5.p2  ORF type:complete len:110 (+),score=14.35 gnl/TRDRNA2_/TRDRNA2_176959_c1_seq5:635-964(+)
MKCTAKVTMLPVKKPISNAEERPSGASAKDDKFSASSGGPGTTGLLHDVKIGYEKPAHEFRFPKSWCKQERQLAEHQDQKHLALQLLTAYCPWFVKHCAQDSLMLVLSI